MVKIELLGLSGHFPPTRKEDRGRPLSRCKSGMEGKHRHPGCVENLVWGATEWGKMWKNHGDDVKILNLSLIELD